MAWNQFSFLTKNVQIGEQKANKPYVTLQIGLSNAWKKKKMIEEEESTLLKTFKEPIYHFKECRRRGHNGPQCLQNTSYFVQTLNTFSQ